MYEVPDQPMEHRPSLTLNNPYLSFDQAPSIAVSADSGPVNHGWLGLVYEAVPELANHDEEPILEEQNIDSEHGAQAPYTFNDETV